MADRADDDPDAVPYRTLLTDPALISVWLISGITAVGYNAVPVALPAIGEAFSLSESGIGLVISAFSVSVLVMLPVVSVSADIYGRRAVVLPSLVVFGLAGLATLFVSSYPALLALRAVQGAAFAGTLPLSAALTGDLYTGAAGSAAQGIRSGFNGLASAVAPVVAGVLAVVAWQYPFVLFALTFPVAVAVYRYYPEAVAPRDADADRLVVELRAYWTSIRAVADRRLAVLLAGGFTLFFIKAGFMTFVPVFAVVGLGGEVTAAGTVLGVYGATRVVVAPLSGSVMVRLGRRLTMLLSTGLAAVGMAAIPFSPTLLALAVASGTYAVGEAILNPVVNDAVAAAASDAQRAGVMSGLQIFKNTALTAAPVVMGALIGLSGYTSAFLLAAALGVGYGLLVGLRYRHLA